MTAVLITGGCGFVGRHFTSELLTRGRDVTIVDDLSSGSRPELWPDFLRSKRRPTLIEADVREYLRDSTQSFDLVLHLAAVVGGRMTIEGDPLRVATDLAIDATFFNWLTRLARKPRKVLYFSSSAAYPIHLQTADTGVRLSEDMISFTGEIGLPDMTYGWSKLTGEFLACHCVERYGLDVVTYRPFSGYGEDQDLTYPFPSIVKRVVDKESPLIIWGSGRQARDFIHIDDVVEIVMRSMDVLAPGEALNLASGTGTTFFELAQLCQEVSGHRVEIRNDPSKPEGVFYRVGDVTRQSRLYTPRVSLREGVERQIDFLARR